MASERRAAWQDGPRGSVSAAQLAALGDVWRDCVEDIPHYGELVRTGQAPERIGRWSELLSIPPLSRRAIQEHPELFIRRSVPPPDFIKTAGSTGTPLKIGVTQGERDLMRIVKLAAWQEFGYSESSRLFLIWGHSHLLGTGWRGIVNHRRRKLADWLLGYRRVDAYRLNEELCLRHARELIRFRPHGLIGYASALDLFARYTSSLRPEFRRLKLGFVLATSEMAPKPDTFALLSDLFD